jgi:hypothetical protein
MENKNMKAQGKYCLELYDQIPEAYRERYDIQLKTSPEEVKFLTLYIHISEGNTTIIPDGKEIHISEADDKLTIKIDGAAEIYMYKKFTLIGIIL